MYEFSKTTKLFCKCSFSKTSLPKAYFVRYRLQTKQESSRSCIKKHWDLVEALYFVGALHLVDALHLVKALHLDRYSTSCKSSTSCR